MTLAREPSWIRSNLAVFSQPGVLTSHDWIQLVQAAGDYLLPGLYEDPKMMEAMFSLLTATQECLNLTSDHNAVAENVDKVYRSYVVSCIVNYLILCGRLIK